MDDVKRIHSRFLSKKYNCLFSVGHKVKLSFSKSIIKFDNSMIGCHGVNDKTTILHFVNSKISLNNCQIYKGCIFDAYNSTIEIKDNTWINEKCEFHIRNKLIIGTHCGIGYNCLFMDTDFHHVNNDKKEERGIIIGNNVWIGANCIILKNVILGNNVIVGAGSVVTKSFPDNVLIAGNPARIIKENIGWNS